MLVSYLRTLVSYLRTYEKHAPEEAAGDLEVDSKITYGQLVKRGVSAFLALQEAFPHY